MKGGVAFSIESDRLPICMDEKGYNYTNRPGGLVRPIKMMTRRHTNSLQDYDFITSYSKPLILEDNSDKLRRYYSHINEPPV